MYLELNSTCYQSSFLIIHLNVDKIAYNTKDSRFIYSQHNLNFLFGNWILNSSHDDDDDLTCKSSQFTDQFDLNIIPHTKKNHFTN
jgi:hypothetical protein